MENSESKTKEKMIDITDLPLSVNKEIANYIKEDTLDTVNKTAIANDPPNSFYVRYGKRFFDIIVSLLAIIVTSPVNLVIAIVTFFDVGTPLLFKQKRVGKDQHNFYIYKFRNMTNDVDRNGELLPSEQRVTKWGRFVRKTSLDELLNFYSILKGDMSIIGPRPLLDYYADRMNNKHLSIFKVRPGLECPPLITEGRDVNWQERLDNYVWYVNHVSLLLDIKMLFRVIQIAFDRNNTNIRGKAGNGGFLGYEENGNVIYTKSVPENYVNMYLKNHGYSSIDEAIHNRNNKII